jgi:hypothetical protein
VVTEVVFVSVTTEIILNELTIRHPVCVCVSVDTDYLVKSSS